MRKPYTLLILAAAAVAAQAAPAAKMPRYKVSSVATPEVLAATNVTEEGFTANWKAVAGADGYAVFVTSREEVTKDGRYTVLYEDFGLIAQGSVIEPVFLDEMTSNLDDYEITYTPDWTVSQCIFAGGKIGGVIWTPYVDVRADGGKYRVTMTIQGYAGQEIVVVSSGSKEITKKLYLADNGNNVFELDFDNGTQDTYLRIVDNGFPDDTEGLYIDKIAYLDDIEVSQNFKAGEDVYRLVAVGESEDTKCDFATLPYRNGENRLYYDLYATSFFYNDPDDPWDYDVDYSDFSPKQEVLLAGYQGIADIEAEANNDFTADGGSIRYNGNESFEVFNLNGQVVAFGRGMTEVSLPAGLYIGKALNGNATKIIVK